MSVPTHKTIKYHNSTTKKTTVFYFSTDFSEMFMNSGKVRIYTMKSSSAISPVNVDFVSEISGTVSIPQRWMCCVDTV
jgi:hypothetical protein